MSQGRRETGSPKHSSCRIDIYARLKLLLTLVLKLLMSLIIAVTDPLSLKPSLAHLRFRQVSYRPTLINHSEISLKSMAVTGGRACRSLVVACDSGSLADRRVAVQHRLGSRACGTVGASDLRASTLRLHPGDPCRQTPISQGQARRVAGSECTSWIDAVTSVLSSRSASPGDVSSRCSIRCLRPVVASLSSTSMVFMMVASPTACRGHRGPAESAF